jgi:hypothetical protein
VRRDIESAPLPPLPAEQMTGAQPRPVPPVAGPEDPGFLGRHVPVAQRGIDLVQGETAAIVSAITSSLPFGGAQNEGGGDAAASSELLY